MAASFLLQEMLLSSFTCHFQPEHSLAARLRAGFVHQLDVAAVVVVHDVVLEVPVLLGADVAHLLGLVLVHSLE